VITLDRVTKRYGADSVAVAELSLTVPDGELCVLVGPSGCGKTTTLRMINRLIEPSGGRILIDGTDVLKIDPVQLRRSIGYVIQQGGLFPHRRVADNVATVPRLLGWDRQRVEARVTELLDLVGLDPDRYGRRFPHELSGGERQRVGVARALGGDPPVLLMDEPFGAVDPVTRQRLQQQFLDLQATLKKTIVFVTHDIEEATKLGNRIAVLSKGGVLEQYDTPSEVLGRPATPFVADFVGADRGVRRLAVMPIESGDLFHPPEVSPGHSMLDARAAVAGGDSRWAVVVDDGAHLRPGRLRRDAPTRCALDPGRRRRPLSRRADSQPPARCHASVGGRPCRRGRGEPAGSVIPRAIARSASASERSWATHVDNAAAVRTTSAGAARVDASGKSEDATLGPPGVERRSLRCGG
jgi:osmoprotectant transport system ATP-binding protein